MTGPGVAGRVAPDPGERAGELAGRVAGVRQRIAAACAAAGRSPDDVVLVGVTKFFPASEVRALAGAGLRDVGESRDQEASAKALELLDLDLRWHFLGQLQTNKARSVVRYCTAVHSLDRPRLVEALSRAVLDLRPGGEPLDVLVQVDLDPQEQGAASGSGARGGAPPSAVPQLAAAVAAAPGLRLRGVMAVAPRGADPEPAFDRLAAVAGRLRAEHPTATWLSAGMSGDLEAAVARGATHVRVGTGLLGARPVLG